MQYNYVVTYDTDMKKWFVEMDTTAYFVEGNVWSENELIEGTVWSENELEEVNYVHYGFFDTLFGTPEYVLDQTLVNILQSIVHTFPTPQEAS